MNTFRDMFPSKYLKVEDIDQTRKTTVTITAVCPVSAASRSGAMGGFGASPGSGAAQADVLWAMYFRELAKPIKLKGYQAEAVFAALHEADPAKWIGRQVQIYAGTVNFGNNTFPKVLISPEPVMGNALPAAAPTTRDAMDKRPIGQKNADAFKTALAEQGASVDEYLAWLKTQPSSPDHDAYASTHGRELAEWPRGAAGLMQAFLKSYKTAAADQAALDADEDIPF